MDPNSATFPSDKPAPSAKLGSPPGAETGPHDQAFTTGPAQPSLPGLLLTLVSSSYSVAWHGRGLGLPLPCYLSLSSLPTSAPEQSHQDRTAPTRPGEALLRSPDISQPPCTLVGNSPSPGTELVPTDRPAADQEDRKI